MTLFGIDGSHHQLDKTGGKYDPAKPLRLSDDDWAQIDFVIWRACLSRTMDESFDHMRDESIGRDKPFCAYHFPYPLASAPANQQADRLAECVGDTRIPVMFDCEMDGTVYPSWADTLEVLKAVRALGFRVTLGYTGKWFWGPYWGSPTMTGGGFDLVNSNYPLGTTAGDARDLYQRAGGDQGRGWQNYGGLDTLIWQFTSTGRCGNRWSGAPNYMDWNAYKGARADLHRWFYDPTYDPNPEDGELTDDEIKRIATAVWSLPLNNHDAWTLLFQASEDAGLARQALDGVPGRTVNFPVPVGDENHDLWTVIVSTLQAVRGLEDKIADLETRFPDTT